MAKRGLKKCCVVTAALIVIIVVVIVALAFTVFKPRDPKISMHLINAEKFSFVGAFLDPDKNITIGMIVTIENPNYGSCNSHNSTSYLKYHGVVVGEAPVEGRFVAARDKINIKTYVKLMPSKIIKEKHFTTDLVGGCLNMTTSSVLPGKVSLLKVIKLNAEVRSTCNISIFISPQRVESICETKLKL